MNHNHQNLVHYFILYYHQHEPLEQSSSVAKHVEQQETNALPAKHVKGDALPGLLISSESPVPIPKVSYIA